MCLNLSTSLPACSPLVLHDCLPHVCRKLCLTDTWLRAKVESLVAFCFIDLGPAHFGHYDRKHVSQYELQRSLHTMPKVNMILK